MDGFHQLAWWTILQDRIRHLQQCHIAPKMAEVEAQAPFFKLRVLAKETKNHVPIQLANTELAS